MNDARQTAGGGEAEAVARRAGIADPQRLGALRYADDRHCIRCAAALTPDDIGAHKKFVNRGAGAFLCEDCLAAYLGISVDTLKAKVEYFRQTGCTLFM